MSSTGDPAVELAQRLRELREERWPGRPITQAQLAMALAAGGSLSVPSISSWENAVRPKTPPLKRIQAYASFFATERSVTKEPFHLFDPAELTPDEHAEYNRLLVELAALRDAARIDQVNSAIRLDSPLAVQPQLVQRDSLLRFAPTDDVLIVCAALPKQMRADMPYPDPDDPDYVEAYQYADIDALLEVHGRLCALNPTANVRIRTSDMLTADDYNSHLILLGGVDWNNATRELFEHVDAPVRQVARDDTDDIGVFTAEVDGKLREFAPRFAKGQGGRRRLVEDVAHCYFGRSPFNPECTVIAFNGMYGRGTAGAVRALTDPAMRDRNEKYVRRRFAGYPEWSLLMRVLIVRDGGVTPDWNAARTRLHEWPAVKFGERQ